MFIKRISIKISIQHILLSILFVTTAFLIGAASPGYEFITECSECDLIVNANMELDSDMSVNCVEIRNGWTLQTNNHTLTLTGSKPSVINGYLVMNRSDAKIRIIQSDHTLSGNGLIQGQLKDATIEIANNKTLTLDYGTRLEGNFTIKGVSGSSNSGKFINNGIVEVNATGVVLVHSDTTLGAGSGTWKLSFSSATLQLDAGSTCNTAIGDMQLSSGLLMVASTVLFRDFEFDGGAIDSSGKPRFWYMTYNEDSDNPNPFDDAESCSSITPNYYINTYPVF